MWTWKGDPVAAAFLETFGIKTVPLHVADVATGLQTGMINAFYAPPLAAIAFQWHTHVGYLLDCPMVNSTGALLIRKPTFEGLSAPEQAALRSSAEDYCKRLVEMSRRDNAEALEVLRGAGIVRVAPDDAQVRSFSQNAERTYARNVPALYSQALLDRVRGILADHRSGKQQ